MPFRRAAGSAEGTGNWNATHSGSDFKVFKQTSFVRSAPLGGTKGSEAFQNLFGSPKGYSAFGRTRSATKGHSTYSVSFVTLPEVLQLVP